MMKEMKVLTALQWRVNILSKITLISDLLHSVEKREADPMHNTYAVYGYNYLPYKYGSGFYTPSLALHNYRYGYVAGYGPRAYSYSHRGY